MPNTITTSIVVEFKTTGSSGVLTAEIDSREDGFNKGRTSFSPGDEPAFLIFKSSDVEVTDIETSAGSIGDLGTGTISITEYLNFANKDEASLQKPITGGLTYKWLGNNLGVPSLVGDTKVRIPTAGVGVLKVTYSSPFLAKRLSGLGTTLNGESEYQVLILITGEQG